MTDPGTTTKKLPVVKLTLKAARGKPNFKKGLAVAASLYASLQIAGMIATDAFERSFHEARLFDGAVPSPIYLGISVSALVLFAKRNRPRLIEWGLPFSLSILFWGTIGLLSAFLVSTPRDIEMQWYCLAMFVSCIGLVGLPAGWSALKFCSDNRRALGAAMGFGDAGLLEEHATEESTLLRASDPSSVPIQEMLRPAPYVEEKQEESVIARH